MTDGVAGRYEVTGSPIKRGAMKRYVRAAGGLHANRSPALSLETIGGFTVR